MSTPYCHTHKDPHCDVCGPGALWIVNDPRLNWTADPPDLKLRRFSDLSSSERKAAPLFSGTMTYFPDALCAVAVLCKRANDKHNPGEPMRWSKDKSDDHADCLARHLLDRGQPDEFNLDHRIAVAWRALSDLQTAIEESGWDAVVGEYDAA